MKMKLSFLLVIQIYVIWFKVTHAGSVYTNYDADLDFLTLNKDNSVAQYDAEKNWWQTASLYQIYPRSFKDSNGDGIGDLNGITERLAYFKEIGIAATWLSPIFTSPMADFGYDVANFTEIDPMYGTMQDFEALIKKANEVGIKIILDFVPNHTSDECEWFKLSAAGDPTYKDFYVWHPGKIVNGTRQPPNNWVSVFAGSAWEWHEGRQAYYLHQFLKKQPDLNYRNPKVKEMMKDILLFWLNKGVAGFRVDAIKFLFEVEPDADGNLTDEPRSNLVTDPTKYLSLEHIFTSDQPETYEHIYEMREFLDTFQKENGGDERVLLTEVYADLDFVLKYYGNDTVKGVQIPFNFLLIGDVKNNSDANQYANTINKWLQNMPAGKTANWVIGNHDNSRVGTRLGAERIDMLNILIMSLPGVSVTYYGEEIGMTDVWISWEDSVDPSACNTNPNVYERTTRDPERTPLQWNEEKNAGFSNGSKTWLPIAKDYETVNVKRQRGVALSHLNIFKRLHDLRMEPTMRHGDAEVKAVGSDNVLGVKRSLRNEHTFITLMNLFDNIETIDLTKVFERIPEEFLYYLITDRSKARVGDTVKSNMVMLMPNEAVVLRSTTKLNTTRGYYAYIESKKYKANNNL